MVEIFLVILFLIPAMLGLAEILHILKLYILKPQNPIISYKMIILTDSSPVEHMKYVIEQYLWQSKKNNSSLIFVNSLLCEENFKACKNLAEHYGFSFYSKEEIKEYLNLLIGQQKGGAVYAG